MNNALDDFLIDKRQPFKFSFLAAGLWTAGILTGVLFKIMHLPFAAALVLISSGGLSAYAFASLIAIKGKNVFSLSLSLGALGWVLYISWGALANDGYPYSEMGVLVFVVSALLSYVYYNWAIRKKYNV